MQKKDYVNHANSPNTYKIDSKLLRVSHFSLGDKSQAPLDQYETTYGKTMKYNSASKENSQINRNWISSVILNNDKNGNYNTETRSKYF